MIQVENLTKSFNGFAAVDAISFDVKAGEIFAFLGPNGAGKSTTIKMLTTLLRPTSGTIRIDGRDPVSQAAEVRRALGIVFQDPSLDEDLTAYENMELHGVMYDIPRNARKNTIEEQLAMVELSEHRNTPVKAFSGGMKRRLEIARAFLHHPKLLILDEPTVGLDPQTRNYLWTYLRQVNEHEGTTIFFTTHYMEEAEDIAQLIAIIDHGGIVATGTLDVLKRQMNASRLEEAFLALTGKTIREERPDNAQRMKSGHGAWRHA